MYKNKFILCTVCARGGSTGIPGKNKALIAGKPLVQYSLESAQSCSYIDDIIISTDDTDIMEIGSKMSIPAPFKRPSRLSENHVPKMEVVRHAAGYAEDFFKKEYDIIIDLSIVSPLRTVQDIKECVKILVDNDADNVFSVSPSYRNPYYNMVELKNGEVKLVKSPEKKLTMRQKAPLVYDMNDSIYVWKKEALFKNDTAFNKKTKIYEMPRERGIDIDDPIDLVIVSSLIKKQRVNHV